MDCAICPLCGVVEESSAHVIWICKIVKVAWRDVFKEKWKVFKMALQCCTNNLQLAMTSLEASPYMGIELIWVTAWSLWNHRNAVVMQGCVPNPMQIAQKAKDWLQEWENAQVKVISHPIVRQQLWQPPLEGYYKINFDGAMSNITNKAGAGAVIRNDRGEFMAAMADRLVGALNSDHIEAFAALQAIEVEISIGLKSVVLEGDSLRVITAINTSGVNLSPIW